MGFNSAFKGLMPSLFWCVLQLSLPIIIRLLFTLVQSNPVTYKVKRVKCTLVQALRLCTGRTTHGGRSRGIALLFHDHGSRRGWGVSVTPRPFFTPGRDPVPIYRRMGGPQGRSGHVRKISPPPGFDPRTVQPVTVTYSSQFNAFREKNNVILHRCGVL